MRAIRRFSLLVCIVMTGSLVIAASAQASVLPALQGRGGGFPPAGNYDFSIMRASFILFSGDPSHPTIDISVSGGPNVSKPLGGPTTTTDDVMLRFDFFSNSGVSGNGCVFLTKPGDFAVSADLQTASLHTTIDQNNPTCGGGFLQQPLTFDVTWTGTGPIENSHDVNQFGCAGYALETQTSDTSNNANATASIQPALTGSFASAFASVGIRDQLVHAQGTVPPQNCNGGIGGKGAGRQLSPAGNYHITRVEADSDLFSSNPSQPQMFLSAFVDGNTSMPFPGASTSTSETDVFFFINGLTVNGGGCFRINPADFTISSDLSAAALHTTLYADGPACQGATNSLSQSPLHLDVTWVGAGPIATTSGDGHFTCLTYRMDTSARQVINNGGTSTTSLTGFAGSFTGTGGLGSSDKRIHAQGVPAQSCTFRG
jgi:hypothetical protein